MRESFASLPSGVEGSLIFSFSFKGLYFLMVAVRHPFGNVACLSAGGCQTAPPFSTRRPFIHLTKTFRWPRHCCSAIPWRTMRLTHRQALVSDMPHRSAYSLLQS